TQHVVYRGADGQIHELFLSTKAGGKWAHANLSAQANAPKAAGDPDAYVLSKTQHVVYRGADGQIHELFLDAKPGSKWGHATPSAEANAPRADSDPSAYAEGDTQHVVYRGTDDQ